jgi:hypothetical protein
MSYKANTHTWHRHSRVSATDTIRSRSMDVTLHTSLMASAVPLEHKALRVNGRTMAYLLQEGAGEESARHIYT